MTEATKSKSTKSYRFVGSHAQEFSCADGTVQFIEPGGFIDLTEEDVKAHDYVPLLEAEVK